jgi:hypothetical protein
MREWVCRFTFLDLGIVAGEWSASRPGSFTLGKESSMGMRLGGPQSWSGRRGEKKILDPTGIRPLGRPTHSQ